MTRSQCVYAWKRPTERGKKFKANRKPKDKDNMFDGGHKLTIDPFGYYCFQLFILLYQLQIKQMQGKAPSGFSLDQSDAFTVNLFKNTISKVDIFGNIFKVRRTCRWLWEFVCQDFTFQETGPVCPDTK